MIRTGQQFLESLRDGRRVLCGGEMIDDMTTHPKTRGFAQALAEYYDMHHDPEHQDVMTFVDENGERWAKHWFLPRTKEDLVARREYHDYIFRHWSRGGDVHAAAGEHAAGLLHALPGPRAVGVGV